MADLRTAEGIGERIQAARKLRGMRSAQELARAVGNATVTESIVANIETGRKADLSVSQLLNIAFALELSPTSLLAALGDPDRKMDLPNLSDGVAKLTSLEFDSWLSSRTDGPLIWGTATEETERNQLQALRELDHQIRERNRLAGVLALEYEAPVTPREMEQRQLWDTTEERLQRAIFRIGQLETYLASAGWDLGAWAEG
jgi:transcriptional regulator with XRE-family HTH domain